MKQTFLLLLILLVRLPLQAQNSPDSVLNEGSLRLSGFLGTYYVYDFNRPANHERPDFLYNHNRHNEFNVNLALLQADYETDRVRAALGLMAGTYAQYNLAHEQPLLQHVFEARVGVRLAPELWLDAGIFPSHIGFESAISLDNWTLTRSLVAENSPYYLSGARLTYAPHPHWTLAAMVVNGWQNIRETPDNSNKALGTQVTYAPHEHLTLNWSSFTGQEQPDRAPQWRFFQNFYGQMDLTERLGVIAGVDVGVQQQAPGRRRYDRWYSPVLILRYGLTNKTVLAARWEHYNDRTGVIIASPTPNGFRTSGYSLGLDHHPVRNLAIRVEARAFQGREAEFSRGSTLTRWNAFVASSLAISF